MSIEVQVIHGVGDEDVNAINRLLAQPVEIGTADQPRHI